MSHETFTIVFEKLPAAVPESAPHETLLPVEATPAEIDEIAELRRIVLEITEPEPASYTTT